MGFARALPILQKIEEATMRNTSRARQSTISAGLLAASVLLGSASMASAADVTFERLRNPEPQNWLMNHHDFGSQRFS
jgi:alcohol dehydrogenase (cytochrome c)